MVGDDMFLLALRISDMELGGRVTVVSRPQRLGRLTINKTS